MAKLSEDLKRMLTGLAYQNAGDFLSRNEKMNVLNGNSKTTQPVHNTTLTAPHPGTISHKIEPRATTKRIAFITNGEGFDEPLDFSIDSCLMQNAQIDLVIHHATNMEKLSAIKKKIINAGIHFNCIQIENAIVDSIIDYVTNQPSLIYIVALPEDAVATALLEEVSSRHGSSRIHTPLVLINNQTTSNTLKQTAAA